MRVVDGRVVEPTANPLRGWPDKTIDLTIDSWLAFLAAQRDEPTIDSIGVTWDRATGIPAEIRLDPGCQAIDDEANFFIEDVSNRSQPVAGLER